MPPFGNLYGLSTYVDKSLAEEDYIVFGGRHSHRGDKDSAIAITKKIVKPQVKDWRSRFTQ
jgi:prolyl-tRNA editing enzyme YbaK/EbsC (Cys-tRNA(Pro) deacylase)